MTDAISEAAEFEHRLPAAYSQGFAHVRVVSVINPDDPGPLGIARDSLAAELVPGRGADAVVPVLE